MASSTKSDETMDTDSEKVATENIAGSLTSGEPVGESGDKMEVNVAEAVGNEETRTKQHIKKDDSGISVEKSENSSDDDASKKQKTVNGRLQEDGSSSANGTAFFPKLKSKIRSRNYRIKKGRGVGKGSSDDEDESTTVESVHNSPKPGEGRSSPDSGHQESSSAPDDVEVEESSKETAGLETPGIDSCRKRSRASESEESDSAGSEERKTELSDTELEEEEITPSVLLKQKPKHKWFVMQEVVNRQKGVSGRCQGAELFQQRCYGSLHSVQRLELMYKLEAHHGCVNALHFNNSGTLLASGSDDLSIVVWDWALGKFLVFYDSGHRSNVFQARFLPLTGDTHIVSCGRDGQIRLAELSSMGVCHSTRRLAQHRGPAHKLAIQQETPHVFLSSGEDALVMSVDVRETKPEKLLYVKDGERKIPLYSIHMNPLNNNEFCVSGRDNYIRIYDKRKVSDNTQLKRFCPKHLTNSGTFTHVTCAVFNYDGTEILGSYNDEDIYLFDTRHPDGSDFIHRFEGHRNNATVKGISFFGPKSEYIVSGSDCGNIYFWDKGTESIVQWMLGDENGVVNCLEPHPQIPVLATSGLDDDVKIWVPSCEQEPAMAGLRSAVVSNYKGREDDRQRDPDAFDGQMLWILWRHIRRTERRRSQNQNSPGWSSVPPFSRASRGSSAGGLRTAASAPDQDTTTSESSSSDSEDGAQRVQCSPS
ncbi:DDB1- and CUL4-associated factor 8 [Cryptotermes secundus]|uniref:DDB1-and CUL4-associated factor 8 n=1 Tax=Cryptotermes secundus TaxID=105785 RepID=A0A2J7R915_9NEOP|nr:DDB1- and CUL4-associated factor 8 isoform X2 [Cryptotermes secundus]PNF37312.1 DDB1- and CUL4-associated factor 8 [Cryptotermes secundus]PNF37313.1 DDB1- and CUL4-associated factor 8 [Cryptotermes secundus]